AQKETVVDIELIGHRFFELLEAFGLLHGIRCAKLLGCLGPKDRDFTAIFGLIPKLSQFRTPGPVILTGTPSRPPRERLSGRRPFPPAFCCAPRYRHSRPGRSP